MSFNFSNVQTTLSGKLGIVAVLIPIILIVVLGRKFYHFVKSGRKKRGRRRRWF